MTTATAVDLDADHVHGWHVPRPQPDAETVEWVTYPPAVTKTVRLVESTCRCPKNPVLYELRSAGGRRHIARIERTEARPVITYTVPRRVKDTDAVWRKILTGEAA
jgi:hypothetical protein